MTEEPKSKSFGSVLYWLGRGVFLESIRRRELPVVLLLMALFICGAIVARFVGAETDAAAAFILNLGLSLGWILSLILCILLGGRQFPDELEHRTIYPLLAKPVARYQYVLGKWLAIWMAGSAAALVLSGLALAASPWPEALSVGALLQMLALEIVALAMVTAIALAASFTLPKAVAYVITALLAFAGGQLASLIQTITPAGSEGTVAKWVTGYIPNFSKLDLVNTFSAGFPALTMGDFLLRVFYGFVVSAFALGIGMVLFERKSL